MTVDFTPMQREGIDQAARWFDSADGDQVFRIFGYAGTGKTTIARALAEAIADKARLKTHFAAYTGKAAMVMRRAGCEDASTIHSAIYAVTINEETGKATYSLNPDGAVAEADLVVIDECSMVGDEIGKDLLSFGKKILILGDPAQLPPVNDGGYFTEGTPDVMLTEIHRQAEGNPIIQLATMVREGKRLPLGTYGESQIVLQSDVTMEWLGPKVMACDQVLVGRNDTRASYNKRMRDRKGLKPDRVCVGDRVVCRKNDKTRAIFNGETFRVDKLGKNFSDDKFRFDATSIDTGREVSVKVIRDCLLKGKGALQEIPYPDRKGTQEFEFAYALTVHLAQGSQWDDVVLFDESGTFREDAKRWLYTGITRASSRILIVRK